MNANHEADDHQDGGQQERHTPAPSQHRVLIVEGFEHEVGAVGQEEADRGAEVREGAVQGALVGRGVLGSDQRGTGPFAGETHALAGAADAQDDDGQGAQLLIAWQQADDERGDTHRHQGDDQRGLAAHAVAEMAEHQGSERACDERDGEGQQAHQQRDGGVVLRGEEDVREVVCRGGAVGVEVIEFDGGTDHRRGDHGLDRIAYQGSGFTCRLP